MREKKISIKLLSFVPALLVMIMIFAFSAEDSDNSSSTSRGFTKSVVSIVDSSLNLELTAEQKDIAVEDFEHLIRKLAHFTEYMLLGISVFIPIFIFYVRGYTVYFISWIFCIVYASSDEFHQLFISGRSASPKDVMIDSLGALTGIVIIGFVCHLHAKLVYVSGNNNFSSSI